MGRRLKRWCPIFMKMLFLLISPAQDSKPGGNENGRRWLLRAVTVRLPYTMEGSGELSVSQYSMTGQSGEVQIFWRPDQGTEPSLRH